MLNPLAFNDLESFKKALMKEGLKRGWAPIVDFDNIDKVVDNILTHHGKKGMKWGVRKAADTAFGTKTAGRKPSRPQLKSYPIPAKITRKTKKGDVFTIEKDPPTRLHKALGRVSKNYRENYKTMAFMTIKDKNGNKIGEAAFSSSKDEIHLGWITIDKSARGRGYATAVLKSAQQQATKQGKKRLILEVPETSPDARHIYEKLGFKPTKSGEGREDIVEMEYFPKKSK